MRWFSVSSLRARLLLLIFLAFLPVLTLVLYTASEQRRLANSEVQRNVFRLLWLTSREYEQLIDRSRQLLRILTRLPGVQGYDSESVSGLFADLLADNPLYANIGASRPNGEVFASGVPLDYPTSLIGRLYYERALETRDFVIGEYQIDRFTRRATINVAYPALNEAGEVQAVVFAAIDLNLLNRVAVSTELPEGSVVTMIDSRGVILVRYPDSIDSWVGRSIADTPLGKTILTQGRGTTEAVDADNIRRIYAFRRLGQPQYGGPYVSIGVPKEAIFTPTNKALTRTLILLGVLTLLAFLAAWFGSDWFIIRRVNALSQAAERLSAGELSARSGLQYKPDEIGQLAHTFDDMASSIEELTHLNQLILSSAGEGIYGLDPNGIIVFINPAGAEMLGWKVEEIIGKHVHPIIHHTRHDGSPYPLEECPTYLTIRDGSTRRVTDEVFWRKDGTSFPVEYVTTPIKEDDRTKGAVVVFTDITERKRVEEALYKSNRMLTVLTSVNQILIRETEEAKLICEVCRIIVEVGGYRMAWIGFAEQDGEKIVRPQCSAGYDEGYLETITVNWSETELGRGPSGTAIRTNRPTIIQDIANDPSFAPWREEAVKRHYASSIAVPLMAEGRVIGTLTIFADKPHAFNAEEVVLLQELAGDLGYGISSLQTREQLKQAEEHKTDFYRRTILAATEGKLIISERDEIERAAGPPLASWEFSQASELAPARKQIADMAREAGMEESRVSDFILCVGEATTNAVKHAGGGVITLHRLPDSLMFVLSDQGPGIEALALPEVALKRGYSTGRSLGMGYKTMISVADQVYLATGPEGTTVAVEMKLQKAEQISAYDNLPDTW